MTTPLNGHTRISTQALTSLAKAAAAQSLGVQPADVRIDWRDDGGLLALSVVAPMTVPDLNLVLRQGSSYPASQGSVLDMAVAAKAAIHHTVSSLSGSRLSRVDIRVSGARTSHGAKVQ